MIVIPASFVTEREPGTDVTKLDRLRIGNRWILCCFLEIAFNLSEISRGMRHKKSLGCCTATKHHMHPLRFDTLDLRKELRVKTELQDCAYFGCARQFRFHDFIRKITQRTGLIHSDEKIRSTAPYSILKSGLVDDVRATADCFNGSGNGLYP